jgi:hypothetical protein
MLRFACGIGYCFTVRLAEKTHFGIIESIIFKVIDSAAD